MRVLVTGSAGFIGRAVTSALQARSHTVVPFDMPEHDVCDAQDVMKAVSDVDGVINLAGILGTSEMFGHEHAAVHVNILGAVHLLDATAQADVPMVQIATGHEGQLNPYAITKGCASQLALARAQWTGQPVSVVRAYHAYGPHQKPPPPYGSATVRKIIPSFVCAALTGEPLTIYGYGLQRIDLVHVDDVADTLVKALSGPYGHVIEAGSGMSTTVVDAARTVLLRTQSRSRLVAEPMRIGEPENTTVCAQYPAIVNHWPHKLDETIGWYRQLLRVP